MSYYVGINHNKTLTHGNKTLFVSGLGDYDTIIEKSINNECTDILFIATGGNSPADNNKWREFERVIYDILLNYQSYTVTLEIDISWAEEVNDSSLFNFNNFILVCSVNIPNIISMGENTFIKIDDLPTNDTNIGVWCHKLADLQEKQKYTSWKKNTKNRE